MPETGTLEEDGVWRCCSETSLSVREFQDIDLKMLCRHCDSDQIG